MLQIGRSGVAVDLPGVARLRETFALQKVVVLPKLLEQPLLDFIEARLIQSKWKVKVHPGIKEEHVSEDLPALQLLNFISNHPRFRTALEDITGCVPLNYFRGRIYRMNPTLGHTDGWHDDVSNAPARRILGMSLNLSEKKYQGGLFQLRERDSECVLAEIANNEFGSAIVFKLDRSLQHRVGTLEGPEPKTAFAGWFRSDSPSLVSQIKSFSRAEDPANTDKG